MPLVSELDPTRYRQPHQPIDPCFIRRWSPRATSGAPISPAEVLTLFEAARWAPSSYNEQPWRFLCALRDDRHWSMSLDLPVPANRRWACKSGALAVVLSKKTFSRNAKPNPVHSFDAGSACENLALQGTPMGPAACRTKRGTGILPVFSRPGRPCHAGALLFFNGLLVS